MNPKLNLLQPYPFEKLARLFEGVTPPTHFTPINISIGEPKHPMAPFIKETMANALDGIAIYPTIAWRKSKDVHWIRSNSFRPLMQRPCTTWTGALPEHQHHNAHERLDIALQHASKSSRLNSAM